MNSEDVISAHLHDGRFHPEVEAKLAQATRLTVAEPREAARLAEEVLRTIPTHRVAALVLAVARRSLGDSEVARTLLDELAKREVGWSSVHYELGVTLGAMHMNDAAVCALRRALAIKPDMPDAWLALAQVLTAIGDVERAETAYALSRTRDVRLLAAGWAIWEDKLGVAEGLLRDHLQRVPGDAEALRMLAEVGWAARCFDDAEALLAHCLKLAPGFVRARQKYAYVLGYRNKPERALAEVEQLRRMDPHEPGHLALKACILSGIGEYEQAIEIYANVLTQHPNTAGVWLNYGCDLKTVGREKEAVEAFRKCIELAPSFGRAYWNIANLKTVRFTSMETARMYEQSKRPWLSEENRIYFHFALAKALEDDGAFEQSFEQYAEANRLHRGRITYDAAEVSAGVRVSKEVFSSTFFSERVGYGSASATPIFVVGLPRAGSTLLEQILSSHSAVEGTAELPGIAQLAGELGRGANIQRGFRYIETLTKLSADECRQLGERYLETTRIHRKSKRPFFVDKMPNNFMHIGLIQLILPHSKIVDARRHPVACCFSAFKQHFPGGQNFTYTLEELARYYRDYVELMAHFDEVLPGRVHRVNYEVLVESTESEVRPLFDYCGLKCEPNCLRFYENRRAVDTASSQQVRRPIYTDGVAQWRHYEQWLTPLMRALGSVLDLYPSVPDF